MKKVLVLAVAALMVGGIAIAQTGEKDCCKKKGSCKKSCKKEVKAEAKADAPALQKATPAPAVK